jgi:oligosaccharyltransferase complex subunit alpha (ribophorin I)
MSKENYEKLSNIRAFLSGDSDNLLKVDFQENFKNFVILKVLVTRGITANTPTDLVIEEYFAQKMLPYPKKIGIFDPQLMLFVDNVHFLSQYSTKQAVTTVKFPSSEVESYTKTSEFPYDLKGKTLKYGPVSDLKSFSEFELRVHYQSPSAIPYFTKVTREIEVSHWGNIAVSDWYTLVNRGAEVKGEFSRFDYSNRYRNSAVNALKQLEAILPRSAWGLYYRDHVGNVSTSNAKQHSSYVHLSINPRFPIMGGWKDTFNIGYNLPTKYFLKSNGEQFLLNITFGFPFKEIIAEEMTVKIVLPEGSSNISHFLPFDVDKTYFETTYSFLDFQGKPVLVLEKKNVMDFHRKPFQVAYRAQHNDLVYKPLILSFYVFVSLLVLIISFRLDLSLDHAAKVKTE